MIIYGTRSAHLKSEQSPQLTCPNCGTQGSLVFSVYRRHTHVFWIPVFPLGRIGFSQCQHCKQTLETRQMNEDMRREYARINSRARAPIWQFAGLMFFAIIVGFAILGGLVKKADERKYIADPQTGDIYHYKTETGSYSLMKVAVTETDSVIVFQNAYESSSSSAVSKLNKPENYSDDDMYIFSREKLREMYDNGEIVDIIRKK